MKIGIILERQKALAVYEAAGLPFPKIPKGKNTFIHQFETKDGDPAILVNQSGHAPSRRDNEEEVNGCAIAIAVEVGPEDQPKIALLDFINEALGLE